MALHLDLEPDDVVRIGNGTVLTVERKSGGRTRIRIDSTYRVTLDRGGRETPPPVVPRRPERAEQPGKAVNQPQIRRPR